VARASDWLRLARAPLAPTAAFDAVACALLARGPGFVRAGATPASFVDLLLVAATSILVYAAGMAGNDWADRRIDRTLHPERPLASGRISPLVGGLFVLACAGGALALGGGPIGSLACVAAALAFAAAYDLGAKRSRVLGPFAMAGVRASNAAVGVVPLLLAGTTHPLVVAAPLLVGLYSAGVTILSEAEEPGRSPGTRLLLARIAAFAAFGGAAALSMLGADSLTFGAMVAASVCAGVAFGRTPRTTAPLRVTSPEPGVRRPRGPLPVRAQVLELLLGLYWLEAVLAGGARPGRDWIHALAAFVVAFGAIYASQRAILALRARA
jgi:4-hydroxybenzoate polyprenyltransferase